MIVIDSQTCDHVMSRSVWHRSRKFGRPKGTGERDETALRAIADLLMSDRALKLTTAMKVIGIRNPNVFRNEASQRQDMEEYDPARHAGAPIGKRVCVNQISPLWASAGRAGYHSEQGLGNGDWIVRRDLLGVLVPGIEEMVAYLEKCAAYFARIGLIEIDGGQSNNKPPFAPW